MQFITLSDSVELVTCIALTPSKKYVFVFEQHMSEDEGHPNNDVYLSIYDLRGLEPKPYRLGINVTDLTAGIGSACTINNLSGNVAISSLKDWSAPTGDKNLLK